MACKRPTNMGNAVAKHDLVAGTSNIWHEEGATAGEAQSCLWFLGVRWLVVTAVSCDRQCNKSDKLMGGV